jgi:hypothetical protein
MIPNSDLQKAIGRLFAITLTKDRFGNTDSACHFDGVDEYIECFKSNSGKVLQVIP